MSLKRSKDKDHRRALRSFAESEALSNSDDDDGLDIIGASRRGLDLSQDIKGLSPTLNTSRHDIYAP
jgi:hypothetical protein